MKYIATFRNKGMNQADLTSGSVLAIQDQVNAEKNKNLPHNSFTIANLNTSCTLFIYLDDMQDQNIPNYVLFPSQQINVNLDDGTTFTTIFIKNVHSVNNVLAKEIKYNISTLKLESEVYE
jgi:hypothetical protein